MDPEIQAAFASLAKLVEDTSQSLQSEMHSLYSQARLDTQTLRSDMERGFERVEAATRRNTTTLVAGASAIAALNRWAGQRDRLDAKRDREIQDLKARLQKVEQALKRRERRAS